jgi:predicted transglutaminase-like cysteine proteinase
MTFIIVSCIKPLGFSGLHRSVWWLLLGVSVFLITSFAAPDLDKTQALAQQRYGAQAAANIVAWRRLIEETRELPDQDKLNKVNTFFNRRVLYQTDMQVWQQEDYWATPLEFMGRGAGDCEDFSIAKYITLQMLGIKNEHLRLSYVRYKVGATPPIAHMVLGYYPEPTAEPYILDNMISSVRLASMRTDLTPVFSFNSDGLWVGGATSSSADPTARLSRWRDVLERMRQDSII